MRDEYVFYGVKVGSLFVKSARYGFYDSSVIKVVLSQRPCPVGSFERANKIAAVTNGKMITIGKWQEVPDERD